MAGRVAIAWLLSCVKYTLVYSPGRHHAKHLFPSVPVHGEPHVADCHGAPVAAVVTLAPGQGVYAQRKPAVVRTLSDYPVATLAWKLNHREAMEANHAT